jgi:hypothetical protein
MAKSRGVVVVVNEALSGAALEAAIGEIERADGGGKSDVHVVAPVLIDSGLKQTLGDVDDAFPPARKRLEETLRNMRDAGVNATGVVGESDPIVAIGDEIRKYQAERIVVVSHADDNNRAHTEKELLERINREFEQPATELRVAGDGENAQVEERESVSAGASRNEEGHRYSRNLPPFRKQDLFGILVALVGTVVLILIAASCSDKHEEQGGQLMTISGGCGLKYLIAGGFFLINLAHVGGLLLMESVGYRGPFERFLARISLIGTPLAIVAVLLI